MISRCILSQNPFQPLTKFETNRLRAIRHSSIQNRAPPAKPGTEAFFLAGIMLKGFEDPNHDLSGTAICAEMAYPGLSMTDP